VIIKRHQGRSRLKGQRFVIAGIFFITRAFFQIGELMQINIPYRQRSKLSTVEVVAMITEENVMAKRLSEQLADLSVRAKSVEDAFAAAQKEAQAKLEVRKDQARTAARNAVERVDKEIQAAAASAARDLTAVKAKIRADLNTLQADVHRAKHTLDVKVAEKRAGDLEWEASFAIDYAVASIEQAKFAVLDAIEARMAAEQAKAA
jgi:hypothetical protein